MIDARNIISRWPSRQDMACDVNKQVVVVHRWWQRQSIPATYDTKLMAAAERRGIRLSFADLAEARSYFPEKAAS